MFTICTTANRLRIVRNQDRFWANAEMRRDDLGRFTKNNHLHDLTFSPREPPVLIPCFGFPSVTNILKDDLNLPVNF